MTHSHKHQLRARGLRKEIEETPPRVTTHIARELALDSAGFRYRDPPIVSPWVHIRDSDVPSGMCVCG